MCGIFASISQNQPLEDLKARFQKIAHRGPDGSYYEYLDNRIFLGFHRLAIMGLTQNENKILSKNGVYLLCNGEIYNHRYFADKYILTLETESDCEVILQLYLENVKIFADDPTIISRIDYLQDAVRSLDGDFAFIIWDSVNEVLVAARDRIGVRPLFTYTDKNCIEFASEEKALLDSSKVTQFEPGSLLYCLHHGSLQYSKTIKWWSRPQVSRIDYESAKLFVQTLLINSVRKRLISHRPVGFLLSGGLDSSLVASIASKFVKVTTFSIGYESSSDLIAARKVAKYLDSVHHEVILTDDDIKSSLNDLIKTLGCYDVTTIRASMPMYILSKYISEKTDIKVLFSGEGSDELFAGYLYLHKFTTLFDLQKELESLIDNLQYFDVRRADRTTARWGLELRVPFLDADLVEFVMALHPHVKMGKTRMEKLVLRDAFVGWLPDEILYRKKEAFSDGVGSRSVELLKQMAEDYSYFPVRSSTIYATPVTNEAKMYYSIFKDHYRYFNDTFSYWMPKWSPEVKHDPSATFLSNY
jgi:asparagine synthase (glutamine-hydrolysing)